MTTQGDKQTMKYNIIRTNPFTSDFESIFNNVFNNYSQTELNYMTVPRANIVRTENGYSIELASPGFSRDEFELKITNNTLTVSVNTEDTPEYEKSVMKREYKFESFERSFNLPETTNVNGISARYDAGILYIDIPIENQHKGTTKITVQ